MKIKTMSCFVLLFWWSARIHYLYGCMLAWHLKLLTFYKGCVRNIIPQYPFAECCLHTVPRIFFYGTDPQCGQETLTKDVADIVFLRIRLFATLLAKKY
jgi:hypothetical protein